MDINDEILLFRKKIDEIDLNILLLLNRRIDISKNVGAIKREKGIAIRDYQREDEVYLRVMQKAIEIGLDSMKVKGIYQGIVAMCIDAQENNAVSSTS
jgi:chorismate mutase/prephenate dehydratase